MSRKHQLVVCLFILIVCHTCTIVCDSSFGVPLCYTTGCTSLFTDGTLSIYQGNIRNADDITSNTCHVGSIYADDIYSNQFTGANITDGFGWMSNNTLVVENVIASKLKVNSDTIVTKISKGSVNFSRYSLSGYVFARNSCTYVPVGSLEDYGYSYSTIFAFTIYNGYVPIGGQVAIVMTPIWVPSTLYVQFCNPTTSSIAGSTFPNAILLSWIAYDTQE
jgi:hypothetical protein